MKSAGLVKSGANTIIRVMPKRPPRKKTSARTKRDGCNLNVWIDKDVYETLTKYKESQRIPPTYTDLTELALREWLEREGFPVRRKA
jgi:hypothetical protein